MSNYKEFQGKTLDEAIQEACRHFDLKRDKLEVEIVAGGSTGIFGLVGAKKAVVKARPRNAQAAQNALHDEPREAKPEAKPESKPEPRTEGKESAPSGEGKPGRKPRQRSKAPAVRKEAAPPAPREEAAPPAVREDAEPPAVQEQAALAEKQQAEQGEKQGRAPRGGRSRREEKPRQPKAERPPRPKAQPKPGDNGDSGDDFDGDFDEDFDDDRQPVPDGFADLNKGELEQTVREVTVTLIEQLVMAPKLDVRVGKDRVNVTIDEPEHSGLIIGREGQTLSSLQYLVNRIVSRRMETSVRVQIDTGDYRERQDDKLKQIAEHLAEKARKTGRTQSTKPLSSYHRRIVHLELQDDERVFTRSKGEGPMKRVLVVPKKRRGGRGRGGKDENGEVNGNR